MRAQEFVTELFQPGKDWKWSFQGSEEAVAVFQVGNVDYMFHAYGADGEWEAEFKRHGSKLDRIQKFGLTGTGNSAEVMSTVVDIMREFLSKYKDKIQVLTFSAKEDSRQGLYARMVKRLLPDWRMKQEGEFFTLFAPKQDVTEAFDQPYPLTWEKSDYGDVDALARLPDGSPLSIMFNKQTNDEGDEAVQVEFYRNNSQEVTSEGDAMRVFATVLTAIQQYVKEYQPKRLTFSASKEIDPTIHYEPGQPQPNPESRAKLYDRLVQRYSKTWGYRAYRADSIGLVTYELARMRNVKENFADDTAKNN